MYYYRLQNKLGFQKKKNMKQYSSQSGPAEYNFWVRLLLPLERFQSKTLHMIMDTPWNVPNTVIGGDLQIPAVKEKISRYSSQYSAHANDLTVNLMGLPDIRRLRRHLLNNLPTS
jgi:hypothetical protein